MRDTGIVEWKYTLSVNGGVYGSEADCCHWQWLTRSGRESTEECLGTVQASNALTKC